MKKYFTSAEYKFRIERRKIRAEKENKRSKRKKKEKNREEAGLSALEKKSKRSIKSHRAGGFATINVPKNFSFIKNPEEIIEFINNLESRLRKRQKVYINLFDVEEISYGAIVLLLSIMVRFKAKNIDFNGNFPRFETPKSVLLESGFFNLLSKPIKEKEAYSLGEYSQKEIGGSHIYTHAQKVVDPPFANELVEKAVKFVSDNKYSRDMGAYMSLVELMANTYAHASEKEGEQLWWLSSHYDAQNKKVYFSFIDFGLGIIESIKSKRAKVDLSRLINFIKGKENSRIIEDLLNGKYHVQVKGTTPRGKGLPGIKEAAENNFIGNLHIISNNVFVNVEKDKYKKLKGIFSGTFVYWEINKEKLFHK